MMEQLLTDRLVELTFRPVAELADWAEQIGLQARRQDDGVVIFYNPHLDFTTALYDALDPINRAVCLATLVFGQGWTTFCPRLLEAVNKKWKSCPTAPRRRQKSEPRSNPPQPSFETLFRRPE